MFLTSNHICPNINLSCWLDLLWINLVKTNKYQYHINFMHSKKVNNTRYDDLGKLMKQTSFTVKNLGGNLLESNLL